MPLKAVICGSFHRQPEKLRRLYTELTLTGCQVISPFSVDFTDIDASFVQSQAENWLSPLEIEKHHLTAIAHADFVWLHLPEGYVGASTALEIGFAVAKQIPLFSYELPREEPFASLVRTYSSVANSLFENNLISG